MEENRTEQPQTGGEAASPKKHNELLVRCLTGTVYFAVLIAFFALKIFVSDLFFDGLVLLMSVIGTYEMLRAFDDKLHTSQKGTVLFFSTIVIITYAVTDFVFQDLLHTTLPDGGITDLETWKQLSGRNYSLHITFAMFITGVSVLFAMLVFAHKNVTLESTGYALLCYIYPSFFLLVLSVCNHLESYSELALLLVFVIAPFADTFAYFFGRLFGKKLSKKLAPNISPKKTLIGGLGGLIGGAIAAVGIFFLYYGLMRLDDIGATAQAIRNIAFTPVNFIFFVALGIVASAFSQFGDLVESAVKRKLGIKDMGKLLPGHGGILDRIDSALYAGLVVCLVLVAKIMIVG